MPRILDPLIRRMEQSQVALPDELRGCSESEIETLERTYNLSLPLVYREYLATMGHSSGRLFTYDHVDVTYPHVLAMTNEIRRELGSDASRILRQDSLIISGRLGEQYEFLRCEANSDVSVWHFNLEDREVIESHASVVGWLQCWCEQAEEAIASGYFLEFPEGTQPS
jgi:hypothetical protein